MKEDRNIPVCCGLFFANSDPRLPGYLGYSGYPPCFCMEDSILIIYILLIYYIYRTLKKHKHVG